MALAKKFRLIKKDIDKVFKQGGTVRNNFLLIRLLSNTVKHLRVAVVISTKVSKSSVLRNKIKRRITQALYDASQLDKPFDLVIIVSKDIIKKKKEEIDEVLMKIIKKLPHR